MHNAPRLQDAEDLQRRGADATETFAHDAGDGDGVQRHRADLEQLRQNEPHQQAAGEEADVVLDREDQREAEPDRAGDELPQRGLALDERPDDAGDASDPHRLHRERRERDLLRRIEHQSHRGPDLADRRREFALLTQRDHEVLADEVERDRCDERTGQHGGGLRPELPRRLDPVPEPVGHVTGQVAALRAGTSDEASPGQAGGHVRRTDDGVHAHEDDAHDAGGVEVGLRRSARGDHVQDEAAHHHHRDDDDQGQLELDDEERGRDEDTGHREDDERLRRHDRVPVASSTDVEQRCHRAQHHLPVDRQGREPGGHQERDARPHVGVRRAGLRQAGSHDQQRDASDEEPDAGAEAHQIGPAPDERREGHAGAVRREATEHQLGRRPARVLQNHVERCRRARDREVPWLLAVAALEERVDHASHRLCPDPGQPLILRELCVLDDQDLAQRDDADQTDDAGDRPEDGHLPDRVGGSAHLLGDHHLGREEVGNEPQAPSGRAHRCDDDHLRCRDLLRRAEEDGEEEKCCDRGTLFKNPEPQHEE